MKVRFGKLRSENRLKNFYYSKRKRGQSLFENCTDAPSSTKSDDDDDDDDDDESSFEDNDDVECSDDYEDESSSFESPTTPTAFDILCFVAIGQIELLKRTSGLDILSSAAVEHEVQYYPATSRMDILSSAAVERLKKFSMT
jgi:hypothetical protein